MTKKTARIGDILEVRTPAGLGYLQYTHESHSMGALVRILPGLYQSRPSDLAKLAEQRELYFTFYTLEHAVRNGDAGIASHQLVPDWAKPYPVMRHGGIRDAAGKLIFPWMIVRADTPLTLEEMRKAPKYKELTPDMSKLSIHALWPHPIMVEELARGWTPERDEEFRLQAVAEIEARKSQAPRREGQSSDQAMRHYLYFPKKTNAQKAGERLRDRGFRVDVRMGGDGKNWLALATHDCVGDEVEAEELRDSMQKLADELHGEYDGWELAVPNEPTVKPN